MSCFGDSFCQDTLQMKCGSFLFLFVFLNREGHTLFEELPLQREAKRVSVLI